MRATHRFPAVNFLRLPLAAAITLAVAHLESQWHSNRDSVSVSCRRFASAVREHDAQRGHTRTLVVGDLNLHPFDGALVQTDGFHAVMDEATARRRVRKVGGVGYPMYYNPMWSFHGDRSPGPPGTYYYAKGGHVELFWHILDQALIGPDLLEWTRAESVKVLASDGMEPLTKQNGRPDEENASDHLPLLVRLYPQS